MDELRRSLAVETLVFIAQLSRVLKQAPRIHGIGAPCEHIELSVAEVERTCSKLDELVGRGEQLMERLRLAA